jgi:hypothetical protein
MKKEFYLLMAATLLVIACKESKKIKLTNNAPAETAMQAMPQQDCYTYVKNRDTVTLSLTHADSSLTGNLTYQLFEKDKNKGVVSGKVLGDTILLDYTFNSEGLSSKRQVAYLKQNDTLVEGFAEVEEKNGGMVFKNRADLKFQRSGIVLNKIDCK